MKVISRLVLTWLWSIALLSCSNKCIAQDNSINGHKYVDLGLSVVWATCNVGSSSSEGYGNYYAWGETSPKSRYTEYGRNAVDVIMSDDISGDSRYDAARANWGASWRLPTKAEMEELKDMCEWAWTTINGHSGYKVTGPSGRSIFLPAAGEIGGDIKFFVGDRGVYWSSNRIRVSNTGIVYSSVCYSLSISQKPTWDFDYFGITSSGGERGYSIRPVSVKPSKNGNDKLTKPQNTQSVSKASQSASTAKKPQMQCTLSDLLTKPFGISYHREFSSYKSRVDELKKISGLDFQYDINTKVVDVGVYPNLFGMTLTAAREAYRENDDRWPGKIVLWYWAYEYRSSNAMTQSQAINLANEIVSSINKIGGKVKISRSLDSFYEIEGRLNNRRLDIYLKKHSSDKKYELSIEVIETEGKYSPYNQ